MKLIVGLGNPGNNYKNTRHNIGFMFLDYYLRDESVNWKSLYNGLYYFTNINGEKVCFLKPQSYMNLSGEVIYKFFSYYKLNFEDILIISDDLDLKIGNFKLKSSGSSGGHNGLKNIEKMLGTSNYKRLKIGIGNSDLIDTKDYVLGKLSEEEKKIIQNSFVKLSALLDDYFKYDFGKLMNLYNKKNN